MSNIAARHNVKSVTSPASGVSVANRLNESNHWLRVSNDPRLNNVQRISALKEAIRSVNAVLSFSPQHIEALEIKCAVSLAMDEYTTAVDALSTLIDALPKTKQYRLTRGQAFLQQQNWKAAENDFVSILELEKNHADAYAGIAEIHLQRGDYPGAYLRAESLYKKGFRSDQVITILESALCRLQADKYDAQIEQDVVAMLADDDIDPICLGMFSASVLYHKYRLHDEDAAIDIALCAEDSLLIQGLMLSILPHPEVESFLAMLRESILYDSCINGTLREELQTICIALGIYAQRIDYFIQSGEKEEEILGILKQQVSSQFSMSNQPEDFAGALLLISMYAPLYPQSFSYKLLAWDLEDWPQRLQTLLKSNLYNWANEHAYRHGLSNPDYFNADYSERYAGGAFPKWEVTQLNRALRIQQNMLPNQANTPERILVVSCGAGLDTIAVSLIHPNAEIIAVDDNLDDLAYASRQADEQKLSNIRFLLGDIHDLSLRGAGEFDLIICHLRSTHEVKKLKGYVQGFLKDSGHLISISYLMPTGDNQRASNTTRLLTTQQGLRTWRNELIAQSDLQQGLTMNPQLFIGEACKRLAKNHHLSANTVADERSGIECTDLFIEPWGIRCSLLEANYQSDFQDNESIAETLKFSGN